MVGARGQGSGAETKGSSENEAQGFSKEECFQFYYTESELKW